MCLRNIGPRGKTEGYTYDNADRLTVGTVTAPTAYTETYGLNNADFIGSKSGEPVTANNWAATNTGLVNQIGSLTPSGGTGRSYTYDADGNVLSDGVNNYTWDAENRLLSITNISTGHVSNFTYDGLGRRVVITEISGGTATTTGYLWCGTKLCSAYNSGGTTIARYLPWGEVQYSGGTATDYYYETDHLGSVVSTTSPTGTVTGTLATDAYGVTLASTGTLPTFGYAGMFLHQPSGLYLTLYRAYDPFSGRWLSRDPSGEGGGINLYGYVGQAPVNTADRLGLAGGGSEDDMDPDPGADLDPYIDPPFGSPEDPQYQPPAPPPQASASPPEFQSCPVPRASSRSLRNQWSKANGQPWPKDPNDPSRNQDACHIQALCDGGTNDPSNIKPMPHDDHVQEHSNNGDFARWGAMGGGS